MEVFKEIERNSKIMLGNKVEGDSVEDRGLGYNTK